MKTGISKSIRLISLVIMLVMLMTLSLTSCDVIEGVIGGDLGDKITEIIDSIFGHTVPPSELPDDPTDDPTDDPSDVPELNIITIAEALELCGESGNVTTERYYIEGIIETVTNPAYGAMVISDETGSIPVYGTYSEDGSIGYAEFEEKPIKGDKVLLSCILQNYNGTKEVKNARLISFVDNQGNIDVSDYDEATILEARAAEKGSLVKVDGVVARITYATGMKPSGFILVDEGASIYVYDRDAAGRVAVGNKVELAGEKDYWILDNEQSAAAKFGYLGCNQLTNVTVVSIDDGAYDFDTSWITETTVKDILDTPVTEDITTTVYKVNALVKKVPGSGFVNYYFFDLDGETGSYTYSQCNGGDFEWLDEFDGKICTVYLTPLNAKSASTECFFRFLPVSVKDEGFSFDPADAPAHALKYYAMEQFLPEYTGDPNIELVTEVSSELLGFSGLKLSYASDNTSAVSFGNVDGKVYLNCVGGGEATVTVTATLGDFSASATVRIAVKSAAEIEGALNIKEAISAELYSEVLVKGIVGPSLVNRDGFYLIDENGVLAIIVNDTSVFGEIAIGNEVVIRGKRDKFHNGVGDHAGQIAITAATVEANYYGEYEYSTKSFITDKTLADFYNLNVNEDHSTEVYVLKATILKEGNQFYTNIKLTDGTVKASLYCSSAAQYSFLFDYAGEEVTLELAACNWNNKTYYAGCVLAVVTPDGKVLNELNFLNNG